MQSKFKLAAMLRDAYRDVEKAWYPEDRESANAYLNGLVDAIKTMGMKVCTQWHNDFPIFVVL